jgi:hypothetical protein|tara:strand:+ start:397 stop:606 length:210 start_codon:yes stop_codon:yes gene_type:complete
MFGEIVYPVSEKRYLYFGRTCVGVVLSMRHHGVGFFGHMFISSGTTSGRFVVGLAAWLAGAKITRHLAF